MQAQLLGYVGVMRFTQTGRGAFRPPAAKVTIAPATRGGPRPGGHPLQSSPLKPQWRKDQHQQQDQHQHHQQSENKNHDAVSLKHATSKVLECVTFIMKYLCYDFRYFLSSIAIHIYFTSSWQLYYCGAADCCGLHFTGPRASKRFIFRNCDSSPTQRPTATAVKSLPYNKKKSSTTAVYPLVSRFQQQ